MDARQRLGGLLAAAVATAGLGLAGCEPPPTRLESDFNGDGFADLAIGVPREDVGSIEVAGAVNVLYGSADGLGAAGNQLWTNESPGVAFASQEGGQFGETLASGHFNSDEYADLAIGAPSYDGNGISDSGVVFILYGSESGLHGRANSLAQGGAIQDAAEIQDYFGSSLAAGDVNGDGLSDLAIGVPVERVGSVKSGVVHLIYGSPNGLTSSGDLLLYQGLASAGETVEGQLEANDDFGASLAMGDFGRTDHDDLAIGAPGEEAGDAHLLGAVNILYGSAGGLTIADDQLWDQDVPGVPGTAQASIAGERFGTSLAAGNLGRSDHDDLAIGVPGDAASGTDTPFGSVNVLYGSPSGLAVTSSQLWHQDSSGVADQREYTGLPFDEGERFGSSLAIADLGRSDHADLAIGVPAERLGASNNGAVHVLYGGADGLAAVGDQFWHQDTPDIEDESERGDEFGYRLAAFDFGRGGQADLAIGVVGESLATTVGVGAINVIYGGSSGLSAASDQFWHQDSAGIAGVAETFDTFGFL